VDSVTQALIGAAAGQAAGGARLGRAAAAVGAVAGTLPDLDVLIRSAGDPLLAIEYHRHFTHALAFVPAGAALAAAPFLLSRRLRERAGALYGAALAGIATHAPLDTFTSYGTQILWPFSNARVEIPAVSIVDPVFTLVLAAGLAVALWRRARAPAALALAFCAAWLGIGLVQNARATAAQSALALARGHGLVRGRVDPTFANQLLWRSVYLDERGRLHADAIRLPLSGPPTVRAGDSAEAISAEALAALAPRDPRIARAARVWSWFADGFMTAGPLPGAVADARYALDPAGFDPFWSLVLRPDHPDRPVDMLREVRRDLPIGALWDEIRGADPRQVALAAVIGAGGYPRPVAGRRNGR
jgi:inner membrane protein